MKLWNIHFVKTLLIVIDNIDTLYLFVEILHLVKCKNYFFQKLMRTYFIEVHPQLDTHNEIFLFLFAYIRKSQLLCE